MVSTEAEMNFAILAEWSVRRREICEPCERVFWGGVTSSLGRGWIVSFNGVSEGREILIFLLGSILGRINDILDCIYPSFMLFFLLFIIVRGRVSRQNLIFCLKIEVNPRKSNLYFFLPEIVHPGPSDHLFPVKYS